MGYDRAPKKQGLYDPQFEHDSCGVGFVCNVKGTATHNIVEEGLNILENLKHRGAVGADPKTGDGAGILIQLPHRFLSNVCKKTGISLPEKGEYGTGLVFLPTKKKDREFCEKIFEDIVKEEGCNFLGWRDVPVDDSMIGKEARNTQPVIRQPFIQRAADMRDQMAFERKLYAIRKYIENTVRSSDIEQRSFFYITNLSSKTLSYKGLLTPLQVRDYFPDLKDDSIESAIALSHSRYSTNTFPTWDLSQPFRFLAHNGEINTLRGNINWMQAREGLLKSGMFGDDIEKLKPIIVPDGSDSSSLDNVFELLVLSGRSLSHAMMMLVPSAWERDKLLGKELRDFYEYHACFMEPWDGPAAIAFTDGTRIGALLDRNGLRPARYVVTKDGLVAMASEAGVIKIKPENIIISGRLHPGRMFFINTELGRIMEDREIRGETVRQYPYADWLEENIFGLKDLKNPENIPPTPENTKTLLRSFGYTREDMKDIIKPMAEEGKEPIGSMGNDTPHAVLSKKPQLLYNYFKQLFAQVTNPPVDPIREDLVMSLVTFTGPEKNILESTPEHCRRMRVNNPILSDEDIEKIRNIDVEGFSTKTISTLFDVNNTKDLSASLDEVCSRAVKAIEEEYTYIVLSDRGTDKDHAAIPMLLVMGAVNHCLINKSLRTRIGIIIETAEARETHHFNLLFGYGADCINPYLAHAAIEHMIGEGELNMKLDDALLNYSDAVDKGIFKTISKMGISTLRGYRGAQIFEALGINDDAIEKCFKGTVSRIGGLGLEEIAEETIQRHKDAYSERTVISPQLGTGGVHQWKKDGEEHLWNPGTINALQRSVREGDYSKYKEFAGLVNDQTRVPVTLRSLLKFKKTRPISINKVEPVEKIVKRFVSGAMSYGSISKEAHEAIAIAMNRLGAMSNTGEGGEDPVRFQALPNGDSTRSRIKQIASGRFGVTANYLVNADEIQIKMAQGAKPGEGGQLPGYKVNVIIARTRCTTPGVTLISPPPHHDIYSIEDLAQLIFDLKNINPSARISVKLVSESGVGTVAAGVAKGHADMILISGGDGGTGASPRSSIRHAGLPWELGLAETHQTLVLNDLRSRVRLQADGQMRTGRDIAMAALLGAEEFGFGTALLITLGCVMLRHCHLNNCSVGVATQNDVLCKKFQGRPEYIVNYLNFVAQDLREIMAELGIKTLDDMVGRTDLLEVNNEMTVGKMKGIDLSRILYKPEVSKKVQTRRMTEQDHGIDDVLDRRLIELADKNLSKGGKVYIDLPIKNSDRSTGTILSGEICRRFGEKGLLEDTVHCKFLGVAGQSFGAFLAKGITMELEGLANDYVGKGTSGGKIIIYPKKKTNYKAEQNILIGNTAFYGATSGEAYLRGIAGERFCVRNSGINVVVEGVGDHACEYMTGGRVVILGKTGRNFGAGMSGGIAYVYNVVGRFKEKCNMEMIAFDDIFEDDRTRIYSLINNHYKYTGSTVAKDILSNFDEALKSFVKVLPVEYKSVLESKKTGFKLGLTEVSDG